MVSQASLMLLPSVINPAFMSGHYQNFLSGKSVLYSRRLISKAISGVPYSASREVVETTCFTNLEHKFDPEYFDNEKVNESLRAK
jgi:hypothetical protein